MKAKELLEKSKLNWEVDKVPLITITGIEVPNKYGLVRMDNQTVLGTCAGQYETFQNEEMIDLLFKISGKTGMELLSGGSFDGGKQVWAQLKSNDLDMPGGDRVEGKLTGINTWDKSRAFAFGGTNTTISCKNTWHRAWIEVQHKVRHTSSMRPNIEEILKSIGIILKEEQKTFEQIVMLSEFRMDEAAEMMVLNYLFELDKQEKLAEQKQVAVEEVFSPNLLTNIRQFYSDLEMEKSQKGDTLWGLFSGVTRYTTHSITRGDSEKSKIFGPLGIKENRIFNELVALVQ